MLGDHRHVNLLTVFDNRDPWTHSVSDTLEISQQPEITGIMTCRHCHTELVFQGARSDVTTTADVLCALSGIVMLIVLFLDGFPPPYHVKANSIRPVRFINVQISLDNIWINLLRPAMCQLIAFVSTKISVIAKIKNVIFTRKKFLNC